MRELLKARLKAAGVAAEAEQVEKLAAFHELLTGANARMNLTRVSADPAEAIDRNYLDSLSPLAHLSGAKTCVDVDYRFYHAVSSARRPFYRRCIGTVGTERPFDRLSGKLG